MLNNNDMKVAEYIVSSKKTYLCSIDSIYSIYDGRYSASNPYSYDEEKSLLNHMKNCDVAFDNSAVIEEQSVGLFVGTFAENEQRIILILKNIGCSCGHIEKGGLKAVYEGTLTDCVEGVLGISDYRERVNRYKDNMSIVSYF